MVLTPDLIWLTADELLQCICDALTAESECPCPCRVYVSAGTPAWDECCAGQLTSWVDGVFFHEVFPVRQTTAAVCSGVLAGDFVVQLLRCAPVVDDSGNAPSHLILTESARLLNQEMYIAMKAIACCLSQAGRNRLYVIRDARPVGPNGGCAGFEIRLTVQLLDPMPSDV